MVVCMQYEPVVHGGPKPGVRFDDSSEKPLRE